MGLTAKLAAFNGTIIGTVFGLAVYVILGSVYGFPVDADGIGHLIEAYGVVMFAFAGAASGNVLAVVKIFPTAPIIAGSLSGLIGGILAWAIPIYLSVTIDIPTGAIGGFIAALVISIMARFLPGL